MKTFLRIFLVLFFVVFSFFLNPANAQTPTSAPQQTSALGELGYTLNGKAPENFYIDGNTTTVEIKFFGLSQNDDFWLFPLSDQSMIAIRNLKRPKIKSQGDGTITLVVCGNGDSALKGKGIEGKKPCKEDGTDYFHEGHIYRLGLYDDENGEAQIMVAEFYVRHSAPLIRVGTVNKGTFDALQANLSGRRPNKNSGKMNNYQLVLEKIGGGYKKEKCFTAENNGQTTILLGSQKDFLGLVPNDRNPTFAQGDNDKSGLLPGDYLLKINEQVNEDGKWTPDFNGECTGGFTYAHIFARLDRKNGTTIKEVIFDPNSSDTLEEEKLDTTGRAPCEDFDREKRECVKVRTAIGTINTTPQGFVGSIFSFILTIAGFGAIIIIIYAGYVLITSRGNKERIAAARETLTSAIVGLLFIIFSLVILEIIGVDILKIPGLSR